MGYRAPILIVSQKIYLSIKEWLETYLQTNDIKIIDEYFSKNYVFIKLETNDSSVANCLIKNINLTFKNVRVYSEKRLYTLYPYQLWEYESTTVPAKIYSQQYTRAINSQGIRNQY